MKILAFDASGKSASVAVVCDGKVLCENFQNLGYTHSKTLLPMLDDLLKTSNINLDEIDIIASTIGPGSYTGIRIAISTVKGLSLALNKKCVGVSTLEVLAKNMEFVENRYIVPVMDARASQVYNAIFKVENGKLVRITDDRAISIDNLKQELKNLKKSYILVGDGTDLCYNIFVEDGLDIIKSPDHLKYQKASVLGILALNEEPTLSLQPKYLRLSQAERERNALNEKQ